MKKLFVVSDIHGHYTELMAALARKGFDRNDPDHVFLHCGDLFDRGKENVQVYDYVRNLERKILIKGNHEDLLKRCLTRGYLTMTDCSNGMLVTLPQMIGEGELDENGGFDQEKHRTKINEIITFIDSMLNYYETENYIFTHGWLPIKVEGRRPYIALDWRNVSEAEWEETRWLEWQQLYGTEAMMPGKTIVCGHRPSWLGYMFDESREPDCNELFRGNGLIVVDCGTARSGFVDVLVIEENDV